MPPCMTYQSYNSVCVIPFSHSPVSASRHQESFTIYGMICAIAEHSICNIACCVSAMRRSYVFPSFLLSLERKTTHATTKLQSKKRNNLSVLTAFFISLHCFFLVLAFDLIIFLFLYYLYVSVFWYYVYSVRICIG